MDMDDPDIFESRGRKGYFLAETESGLESDSLTPENADRAASDLVSKTYHPVIVFWYFCDENPIPGVRHLVGRLPNKAPVEGVWPLCEQWLLSQCVDQGKPQEGPKKPFSGAL